MYLSRLILNPQSRQVQHEVSDPYEMHRTISRAFPAGMFKMERQNPDSSGVLFRVDSQPVTGLPLILVQSTLRPDWSTLINGRKDYLSRAGDLPPGVENPAVKQLDLNLRAGQVLIFRLRANPTVKKDRPGYDQGRRVGLYREEEQSDWLSRKFAAAGSQLFSLQINNKNNQTGKLFTEKEPDRRVRFFSVQFDGQLRVVDPDLLLYAVHTGIGPSKGFGCGLLSLAPA